VYISSPRSNPPYELGPLQASRGLRLASQSWQAHRHMRCALSIAVAWLQKMQMGFRRARAAVDWRPHACTPTDGRTRVAACRGAGPAGSSEAQRVAGCNGACVEASLSLSLPMLSEMIIDQTACRKCYFSCKDFDTAVTASAAQERKIVSRL